MLISQSVCSHKCSQVCTLVHTCTLVHFGSRVWKKCLTQRIMHLFLRNTNLIQLYKKTTKKIYSDRILNSQESPSRFIWTECHWLHISRDIDGKRVAKVTTLTLLTLVSCQIQSLAIFFKFKKIFFTKSNYPPAGIRQGGEIGNSPLSPQKKTLFRH